MTINVLKVTEMDTLTFYIFATFNQFRKLDFFEKTRRQEYLLILNTYIII